MTVEFKNTPYVFLSYSHNDKDMIDKIYKALSYMGFHCWIDEKIRAMENFNSVIEEAIENCTVFLSFFSKVMLRSRTANWSMIVQPTITKAR